jgi:microcystin-dependent protein
MNDEYLGVVKIFAGNFAPLNFVFCHGQLMSIAQNQALFSLLGTTYGGDGRTTFAVPDLRGAAPIGSGTGPGLTPRSAGQRLGTETTTLNIGNLPSHNHIITVSETAGTIDIPVNTEEGNEDESNPGAGFLANTGTENFVSEATTGQKYGGQSIPVNVAATATASNTGNGNYFNNMQPSSVVNYIICTQGLYPSRS